MAKLFEKIDDNPGSYFGMLVEEYEDKEEVLKEDKFVSRDKMSKKDRKELDSKKRNTWGNTNPVTKVQPNKKAYDRKRDKKELDEDINSTVLDNRTRSAVKEGAMSLQYINDLLFDAIDDSNSTYGDLDNTINEIRKIADFLQDVYYRYYAL